MSSPTHEHVPSTRHFERWQGNWIRREPKATENPVTRFPSGGKRRDDVLHVKNATASRSREISLVNDYDGVFKESVES
ncbi:MAG: hypothetical protein ACFWUL_10530 [Dialister sp.]|jgi:hypothetical protein